MIICAAAAVQRDPVVAYNGEDYVVAWSDMRFTENYFWLTVARVDTAGVVLDTGQCIGAQKALHECCPDIAFDGNRCLVVWYNNFEPYGVFGRFVDAQGQPDDSIITVANTLAGYNVNPSITFAGGDYLIVWADQRTGYTDLDICGQLVSPGGQLLGDHITVATGSLNQKYPQVCSDGTRFLVVWREGTTAIFGQWLDLNGSPIAGNFPISDGSPYYRFRAGVAASPENYLVAWSEVRDDETDIFGNNELPASVEDTHQIVQREWPRATIFKSVFPMPEGTSYQLFDVCGREVTAASMTRGIYYLQVEGRIIQKLIKME